MVCIIATNRIWYEGMVEELRTITGYDFVLINKKQDLSIDNLNKIKPKYIFFPHWSFIIPSEVYNNFECIIFHMTDVPFGRGGSPLQNLIARKIYETKISALKCTKELDAGDVYLKYPLSLYGTAEEIYIRAANIIKLMIQEIIQKDLYPITQNGEIVTFRRRLPEEGNIANLSELEQVFDYIRMLDAEDYPKAFLETKHFKFEFQRASLKNGFINADVKITKK